MIPTADIQPWFQFNPLLEGAEIEDLTNDERGLFFSFRIYSWKHNGLPSDPDALKKIAVTCCGISRYKFLKVWETVKHKFENISPNRIAYLKDEGKRLQPLEVSRKFQELGRKGAAARWKQEGFNHPEVVPKTDSGRHPSAIDNGWHTDSRDRDRILTTAAENTTIPGELPNLAAAVENPSETQCPNTFRLIASIFRDVTPAFIERLLGEARKILPDAADDDLARAVRATYRAKKQESAGLFLTSVPAWLQNLPPRKKSGQPEDCARPSSPGTVAHFESWAHAKNIPTGPTGAELFPAVDRYQAEFGVSLAG